MSLIKMEKLEKRPASAGKTNIHEPLYPVVWLIFLFSFQNCIIFFMKKKNKMGGLSHCFRLWFLFRGFYVFFFVTSILEERDRTRGVKRNNKTEDDRAKSTSFILKSSNCVKLLCIAIVLSQIRVDI